MQRLIAIVDCNNFYASAERLCDPSLRKRPVIVLSSNDANVIARSQEAKDLGIEMGAPYFQISDFCARAGVIVRSSNFALYGDVSSRVMRTIATLAERMEIYSIDETFLHLQDVADPEAFCAEVRSRVGTWCGIPVSIGIAETKTLAKIANRTAKKSAAGIYRLPGDPEREELLAHLALTDVWGIAGGFARRLEAIGIATPAALRAADPVVVQRHLGIVGRRVAEELQGIPCVPSDELGGSGERKTMCISRSFGAPMWTEDGLRQAVCTFASRAGEKLRAHQLRATRLQVFAHNSRFRPDEAPIYHARGCSFPLPTNDSGELLAAASTAVHNFFQPGTRYTSAGVLLTELVAGDGRQTSLFVDERTRDRRDRLLQAIDALNRQGRGTVRFASAGLAQPWAPRCSYRSPRWTTRWDELPMANGS